MHVNTLKFYKYSPIKKPIYKGKFCWVPFEVIQIDEDGDVMLCDCQLHMPYVIGNIYQQSLSKVWSGEQAQKVRQSVIDGDFTYCNWPCSILQNLSSSPAQAPALLDFPVTIKLDLDRSCNLKCPSCRENVIIEKQGQKINKQIELYAEIVNWARQNPDRIVKIIPLASGEIFASHSGLKFLQSLADYPYNNIQIQLVTNGTLIYRNRELLSKISHLINHFSVSIDAATAETYSVIRGGDWNELLLGLEYMRGTGLPLNFNFCVQQNNWHEIEQFAEFSAGYNATMVYQKLLNWGHWNSDWWHNNNVFDRTRSTFESALESLQRVQKKHAMKASIATDIIKYLQSKTESP